MDDVKMSDLVAFARKRKTPYKRVKFSGSSSSSSSSARILHSKLGKSPESKCVDVQGTSNFSTVGVVTPLNVCVQGPDINQRIGRRYCLKSLQLRGYISAVSQTAGDPAYSLDRALLVYDRQPNGVLPNASDILINMSTGTLNATTFVNLNNSKRFVILGKALFHDCNLAHIPAPIGIIDCTSKMVEIWVPSKKIKNLVTEFNAGVAGTIADINVGALYLVTIGQFVNTPSVLTFSTRTRFCDL